MQVVLLAGGLGTRLRPVTERIPKPMVEVGGHPFVEYVVRHLAEQNFRRLLFLVGYLGEQIQEFFGSGRSHNVAIDYCFEPKPLGTGGAVCNALERLDGEFLLLYADSFLPIDYHAVARAFREVSCLGLLVAYDNRLGETGVVNNVAIDAERRVSRYEKGSGAPGLEYVEAGVLCFRREVFALLPPDEPVSLEQDVYPGLIERRQLRAHVVSQRFFDIGTPERLREFEAIRR